MATFARLLIGFAFYLLLAGQLGIEQFVSAVVMAGFVVLWSGLIRKEGSARRFVFTRGHVAPWLRALAKLPGDTVRIGAILGRTAIIGGSPGRAIDAPFRFGPTGDATDAARRASAVAAGSLTPDTFVVEVAEGKSQALCHKLTRTPGPDRSEWLA